MTYQMAATVVTLNDLERLFTGASLFKCNLLNICAAFYTLEQTVCSAHMVPRAALTELFVQYMFNIIVYCFMCHSPS